MQFMCSPHLSAIHRLAMRLYGVRINNNEEWKNVSPTSILGRDYSCQDHPAASVAARKGPSAGKIMLDCNDESIIIS